MNSTKAILFAILAAVLYSLMTPVSKLLLLSVPPVAEAGLLYLGAGTGMLIIKKRTTPNPCSHRSEEKT